jgi:hypothetical protein
MSHKPSNHRQRLKRRRAKKRAEAKPQPMPAAAAGVLAALAQPVSKAAWDGALKECRHSATTRLGLDI